MKSIPQSSSFFKCLLFILTFTLGLFSSQLLLAQPASDNCSDAIHTTVELIVQAAIPQATMSGQQNQMKGPLASKAATAVAIKIYLPTHHTSRINSI